MFSSVRRRLTYANVMVTFALLFAMSGGAYAAGKFLITSTKQISPKVLKSLKGATGKNGATGPGGPAGPAGAQGSQGAKGETGAAGKEGPQGKPGEPGKNGENGKEGSPWTAGGTLPSGETETGAWSFSTSNESFVIASISFPIPLAKALGQAEVHYVGPGGDGSTCPGTATEPKAEKGNLCVYEKLAAGVEMKNGVAANEVFVPGVGPAHVGGEDGAGTTGAEILFFSEGAGATRIGWGTWAVTAE